MEGIFFAHPHTLLDQAGKVLDEIGPEKFLKSPNAEVKKIREGFLAYFFTLAMKKYTGKDWLLAQYDQAIRAYPDFDFFSFAENPNDIKIEPVELTGVYPHFKSFDEVIEVIEKKQKKYGNELVRFSLLVFVNHEKSEEWINMLREKVKSEYPFLSIWTIHLRFKKGGKEVGKAVAQRIVPAPGLRIEAETDDSEIHKRQPLPIYMEECRIGEHPCIKFKDDFIDKIKLFQFTKQK